MRRKQCLHEGDRSDAALQMLDDVKQGLTYAGWEADVRLVEKIWARDGHVDIQREVERMRRKQCLHEGGRSDAALQMLDDVKQGLTYAGWEEDVGSAERRWARDGHVDIQREVGMMRRKQRLHDVLSEEADASGRVAEASLKPKLDLFHVALSLYTALVVSSLINDILY